MQTPEITGKDASHPFDCDQVLFDGGHDELVALHALVEGLLAASYGRCVGCTASGLLVSESTRIDHF